jgi:hypothetical protein
VWFPFHEYAWISGLFLGLVIGEINYQKGDCVLHAVMKFLQNLF